MPYEDYDISRLIFDQLGEGSYGAVFKIRRLQDNKEFALKLINNRFNDVTKIEQEACIQKQFNHQNIANIIEYFHYEEQLYIIMDLYEGDLFQIIQNQKDKGEIFEYNLVYKIFKQLISVLSFLHSQKILHRDVKPQNLLVDNEINIYLSDFGTARKNNQDQGKTTNIGTQDYMSPELFENLSDYDYQPDIWASGVVLCQMMTFSLPFKSHADLIYFRYTIPKLDQYSDLYQFFSQIFINYKQRKTADEILSSLNSIKENNIPEIVEVHQVSQFKFKDLFSQKLYSQFCLSHNISKTDINFLLEQMINSIQTQTIQSEKEFNLENENMLKLSLERNIVIQHGDIAQIRQIAICLLYE